MPTVSSPKFSFADGYAVVEVFASSEQGFVTIRFPFVWDENETNKAERERQRARAREYLQAALDAL